MAVGTSIEWTEATWNPTTGCDQVSVGCDNCYALTLSKRLKAMGAEKYQNDGDPRTSGPGFGVTVHPDALLTPYAWKQPRDRVRELDERPLPRQGPTRLRPAGLRGHRRYPATHLPSAHQALGSPSQGRRRVGLARQPLDRRQRRDQAALSRIDDLRRVPAAVRFLSCEPLLGPLPDIDLDGIDWVITGGESGPNAPPDPARVGHRHPRRMQLRGVPFFFKQWGGRTPKAGGRTLEGMVWDEMPAGPSRWPDVSQDSSSDSRRSLSSTSSGA